MSDDPKKTPDSPTTSKPPAFPAPEGRGVPAGAGAEAVPTPVGAPSSTAGFASSTSIATRRSGSGAYPIPSRPMSGDPMKPSIADALRETADAVQEAVRELTGKTTAPPGSVAMVQPT